LIVIVMLSSAIAGCGRKPARAQTPIPPARIGSTEIGVASWYGVPYHGRRAASGEIYDMEKFTAAHRLLPFETWVQVTNLQNGKHVEVRITDRGPFVKGRIIDLSRAAARDIQMLGPGTAKVRITVIAAPSTQSLPELTVGDSALGTGSANYAVQAGAFADRERAEGLRARMAEVFGEARVLATDGTPPLWRVVVGRAIALERANELAVRVREETGAARVIEEPVLRP